MPSKPPTCSAHRASPHHADSNAIVQAGRGERNTGLACYARRVRYVLAVFAATVSIVTGLKVLEWTRPAPPTVQILGIAAPQRLAPGEHAAVYGGLSVPAGSYELGLWTCSNDLCKRTSWIRLRGPTTVWRWLGSEEAPSGQGRVVLRLYDVNTPYGDLVWEWSQRFTVR